MNFLFGFTHLQASPDHRPLVFGTVIGVVTGSVALWDARPGCVPPGSSEKRRILTMVTDVKEGGDGRDSSSSLINGRIKGSGGDTFPVGMMGAGDQRGTATHTVASRQVRFKVGTGV